MYIYLFILYLFVRDLAWQRPNVHAQLPRVRTWLVKVVNILATIVWLKDEEVLCGSLLTGQHLTRVTNPVQQG